MYNIMSKAKTTHITPSVELDTIWQVNADASYDVTATGYKNNTQIALRTLEGKGILIYKDGTKFELTRGTLAVFKLDNIKRYYCSGHKWSFIWFEFSADTSILPKPETVHSLAVDSNEKELMYKCFNRLNSPLPYSAMSASCEFCSLLIYWVSVLSYTLAYFDSPIEKIIAYVMQNPSESFCISTLSKKAGMSERAFRDAFIKHTNMPPKRYFEEKKLNAAAELLQNTDIQIKELSYSLGYTNQYYFSRAFSKYFGVCPKEFRKEPVKYLENILNIY